MTTNSSTAKNLASATKSVRNWTIGFVIAAAVTLVSIAANNQSIIATSVMMFMAAMVCLKVHEREKFLVVPVSQEASKQAA